jgi:hypothetical protein
VIPENKPFEIEQASVVWSLLRNPSLSQLNCFMLFWQ